MGSVARNFQRKGVLSIDIQSHSVDAIMEASLELGAETLEEADGQLQVPFPYYLSLLSSQLSLEIMKKKLLLLYFY